MASDRKTTGHEALATPAGPRIVAVARWGTAAFVGVSVAGVARPAAFGGLAAAVDLALFAVGCVTFFLAYIRAVRRSRTDSIGIGGLYFLAGEATPPAVRRALVGPLVVQVAVALVAAALRPYTILATGVLVPIYGLGLCGYWASRYGAFPPRPPGQRRRSGGDRKRP